MKDLDRLMSIARRATPGPWEWEPPSDEQWPQNDESLVTSYIEENEDYPKLVLIGWGYDASGTRAEKEDREFIAEFNPQKVIELLTLVETAELALQRVRAVSEAYAQQPEERELCGAVAQSIRAALEGDE